jgi:hypothetical protein
MKHPATAFAVMCVAVYRVLPYGFNVPLQESNIFGVGSVLIQIHEIQIILWWFHFEPNGAK